METNKTNESQPRVSSEGRRRASEDRRRSHDRRRPSRETRRSGDLPRKSGTYYRPSNDLVRTVIDENQVASGSFADDEGFSEDDDHEFDREDNDNLRPSRADRRRRRKGKGRSPGTSPRVSMSRARSPFMADGSPMPASPVIAKRSSSLHLDRSDINLAALASGDFDRAAAPPLPLSSVLLSAHAQANTPVTGGTPQSTQFSLENFPSAAAGSAAGTSDRRTHEKSSSISTTAPSSILNLQNSPQSPESRVGSSKSRGLFGTFQSLRKQPLNASGTNATSSSILLDVPAGEYTVGSRTRFNSEATAPFSEASSGIDSNGFQTLRTKNKTSEVAEEKGNLAPPRASMSATRAGRSLDLYNSATRQKLAAFDNRTPQSLYAHPDDTGEPLAADPEEGATARNNLGTWSLSMEHQRRKSVDSFGTKELGEKGAHGSPHGALNEVFVSATSLDIPRETVRGPSMDLRRSMDVSKGRSLDVSRSMDIRRSTDVGRSLDMRRPSMAFSTYGRNSLAPSSFRPSGVGERPMGMSNDDTSFVMLERVTSEPIRGGPLATAPFGNPLRYHYADMPIENISDMKQAVAHIGPLLEERRKRGIAASKSKDGRFWLAFMGIAITGFLSATDMTIIAPILPTVAADLPPSSISATWITSAFLLTMTAFQPLWGGVSDAIGRRWALLASLLIFLVGSIPCTIATTMLTMVAGRGLQGVGGGGMLAVGEVMLSDMTTLAERGYFLGLLSMAFAAAAIAAPLVGGVFASAGGLGWRWSFLINFPIGLVAFVFVFTANHLRIPALSWREKFARFDAPSTIILFGATLSLLVGLTRGGEGYGWANGSEVLAPLIIGAVGYVIFFGVQWWPYKNYLAPRPVLSRVLFFGSGRTAAIAFILTFLHGFVLYGAVQTLILYFETRDASPLTSAINVLPANAPSTPAAFVAGILMAVTGRYKGLIVGSQFLMLVGFGMLVYLDGTSPTYQWALFQVIASIGIGALYTLSLPPIQACVPPAYLARATATFAFVRSFGAVWGISGTLIAFTSQADKELAKVPGAAEAGLNGASAIGATTAIRNLEQPLREEVRLAVLHALRASFISMVPFAFIGLVLSLFIRHVPLPDFNTSEFGLEQHQEQSQFAHGKPKANMKDGEEHEMSSTIATTSPRFRHGRDNSVATRSDVYDLEKGFGTPHSRDMRSSDMSRAINDEPQASLARSAASPGNATPADGRPSESYMSSLRRSNSFWR